MNQTFTTKRRHIPDLGNLRMLFEVFGACMLLLGNPTFAQQGATVKITEPLIPTCLSGGNNMWLPI